MPKRRSLLAWFRWLSLLLMAALLVATLVPDVAAQTASSTVTGRVLLTGQRPLAVHRGTAQPLGTVPGSTPLTLVVGLKLSHPNALQAFLHARKSTGSSSPAGIGPQQFAAWFGPSASTYLAVENFLRQSGFSVQTSPNRLLIVARGTASQAEKTFGVSIHNYRYQGGTYYAPASAPAIPSSLAADIQSVAGLDNFPAFATPLKKVSAAAGQPGPASAYFGSNGFTPLGIQTAYNFPTGAGAPTGAGQSVDVVIWNAVSTSDVTAFDQAFNLPPAVIHQFPVGGTPTVDYSGGTAEADADTEWIHALAPGASINVYEATSPSLAAVEEALNEAVVQHAANVLNMSWGASENQLPAGLLASYNAILAEGAAQGMTLVAASGDNGAYNDGATLSVSYPASDPYVLAAGGTVLHIQSNGSYSYETAWNCMDGLGICGEPSSPPYYDGGGGGFSGVFAAPSYQSSTVNQYTSGGVNYNPNNLRGLPDVSFNAGGGTAAYVNGTMGEWIGTSFAAPSWSAIAALANQQLAAAGKSPLGFTMPLLYQTLGPSPSSFHDVTLGNNNGLTATGPYPAGPGWDPATGWGSPNVANLLGAIGTAAALPSITLSPTSLVPSYPAGTVITVQGQNTHFASGTTVQLEQGGVPVAGAVSHITVQSPTRLTFQLQAGMPSGFYTALVSDATDGSLSAPLEIGSASIAISPSQVRTGYGPTDIQVTGNNTQFVAGQLSAQVVQAANLVQVTPVITASVTGPTTASFALPSGLAAGNYDVVIYDDNDGVALIAPLQVVTGPAVTVRASPSSLPANGTSSATLTATVVGPDGAPAPGISVNFTTTLGTLGTASAITNSQGQATDALTSTTTGTATVTATAYGVSGTATVSFHPAVTAVQVAASPTSLPANGTSPSTVTATVLGPGGSPLSGAVVDFSTTLGSLATPSAITNSQGQATDVLTSSAPGTATVTANAYGTTGTAQVTFTAPPVTVRLAPNVSSTLPGNSSNWDGLVVTQGGNTGISGQWTVPSVLPNPTGYAAEALGIGGYQTSDLLAVGTQQQVTAGGVTDTAWWDAAPGQEVPIGVTVHPGDTVSASLTQASPGEWRITFQDLTTGQTFSRTVAYTSSLSSAEVLLAAPSGSQGIMPLANFSPVTFQQVQVTQNGTTQAILNDQPAQISLVDPATNLPEVLFIPAQFDGGTAFYFGPLP